MQVTDPVTLAMLQMATTQRDNAMNDLVLKAGDVAEAQKRIAELETRVGVLEAENAELRKVPA